MRLLHLRVDAEMYRTERPNQSSELPLGGGENLSAATSSDATSSNISESSTLSSYQPSVPQATQTTTQDVLTSLSVNPTRVKRVILLLDDHTFESYEVKR